MSKAKTITVEAAETQELVEAGQCAVYYSNTSDCYSTKEAKQYAKRLLSPEYHAISEASAPLGYSRVTVDGQCVADFFPRNN